jgi:enoyl-CoA hydratase
MDRMPNWPDPQSMAGDVLIKDYGRVGLIGLNRPQAMNALTLAVVRQIAAALDRFEAESTIERVAILSTGGRAFCAGGDIRVLGEHIARGDTASALTFWREEYHLNRRIKRYRKPYIALIDGLVMGGGVGVSVHGSHRIAGDHYAFAMPEVGIGFFPDVGATFFLPRCPGKTGCYLALTGLRATASDAVALGLATASVDSQRFGELLDALAGPRDTDLIIDDFSQPVAASGIMAQRALIDHCCSAPSLPATLERFQAAATAGSDFAKAAAAALVTKSPTSLAIAWRQMHIGASLDFDEALRTEYRIVVRLCGGHDFREGIRAVIIDKDNRPRWDPASLDGVDADEIARYFAPLDPDLSLPAPGRDHAASEGA